VVRKWWCSPAFVCRLRKIIKTAKHFFFVPLVCKHEIDMDWQSDCGDFLVWLSFCYHIINELLLWINASWLTHCSLSNSKSVLQTLCLWYFLQECLTVTFSNQNEPVHWAKWCIDNTPVIYSEVHSLNLSPVTCYSNRHVLVSFTLFKWLLW
jgi:hypothetical protein